MAWRCGVGAEVEATLFVHMSSLAYCLASATAAGQRQVTRPCVLPACWSPACRPTTLRPSTICCPSWSVADVREWREREVEEQQQRAAAEYTASPRERLGNALDLPLLTGGDDGITESWLARVLGGGRAFARCSVSPAQALTDTHTPLAGLRVGQPCASWCRACPPTRRCSTGQHWAVGLPCATHHPRTDQRGVWRWTSKPHPPCATLAGCG